MGILNELKRLTQPFDDDSDDFFDDSAQTPISEAGAMQDGAGAPAYERKSTFFSDAGQSQPHTIFQSRRESRASESKVVNLNTAGQVQVVIAKPERFEAAAEIADHLRNKRTVVMNLEGTDKDISRRLIDFLSGVAYAQDGKIRRVANNTYLIMPCNVDLMGDLLGEIENNSFYS